MKFQLIPILGSMICVYQTSFNIWTEAAEPADELILISFGTIGKSDFFTANAQIRRINKTHQVLNGTATLTQLFTNNMTCELNMYKQDAGGWHPMLKRQLKQICSIMFDESGLFYGVKATFLPNITDGCPVVPGNYSISKFIVPRYRKDWHPGMQLLIPLLVPSADKWRLDIKIFNGKQAFLTFIRIELRLINEYSSQ